MLVIERRCVCTKCSPIEKNQLGPPHILTTGSDLLVSVVKWLVTVHAQYPHLAHNYYYDLIYVRKHSIPAHKSLDSATSVGVVS